MGKVAVSLKIMPETPDTDLNKIKDEIAGKIELKDSKIEPLAFGLSALKILVVVLDESIEGLESKIREVDGISEVTVESSTLI